MKIEYEIIHKADFNDTHREIFAKMLKEQGKVQGNLADKIDRCRLICIVKLDDNSVAIGAIKRKNRIRLHFQEPDYLIFRISSNGN